MSGKWYLESETKQDKSSKLGMARICHFFMIYFQVFSSFFL